MPMKTRRALLFMPGDDARKIEKGARLEVDSIIMDLEDGVALTRKESAREVTREALENDDFGKTERLVRLNAVDETGLFKQDIEATIAGRPDGYVMPKAASAEQLLAVDALLHSYEQSMNIATHAIELIAIIETAMGVVRLREICEATPRLKALAFGAEDLAGDMGAVRTPDNREGFYAQSAVVLHAKAYGLQAIDTPFINLGADDSVLAAQTERAMQLGYTGKFAIHPRQITVIQQMFTPTASQIDAARRLIQAHEEQQANQIGVFVLDGRMVDMPMVRAAQAVLDRARAAGIEA
jgi:citrate lyase beta subunit